MKHSISILITLVALSPVIAWAQSDENKVNSVLSQYKDALEKLDVSGTGKLFLKNSQIVESGSVEGTYEEYLTHHIGPELADFKSFTFDNYKVDVTVTGESAFAVETYDFTIVLKKDNSIHKRKGVASSFLNKENGIWKIVHMHNSSRKP